jgi:hypothetical protein
MGALGKKVNVDRISSEQETIVKDRRPAGGLISAGEVGQFVFCPEAWHLRRMMGQIGEKSEKSEFGKVEHDDWGGVVDRLEAVRFGLRVLFGLCVAACVIIEWGIGR